MKVAHCGGAMSGWSIHLLGGHVCVEVYGSPQSFTCHSANAQATSCAVDTPAATLARVREKMCILIIMFKASSQVVETWTLMTVIAREALYRF